MQLYSAPLSPFAARVRLSIYRKGLDIAIVPPPPGGLKGEAFLALSPMGQIPVLELADGTVIPESSAILEYLEDAFPTPSLRPAGIADLARARLFMRIPDIQFQNAPRILLGMRNPADRDALAIDAAMTNLERGLLFIDHYLDADAGPWAVGGHASIADCALVPVLNAVSLVAAIFQRPDLMASLPKLNAYWSAAQSEEVNARVIAEQLAAIPR